jgi:4-nitrophenyl phosphatase
MSGEDPSAAARLGSASLWIIDLDGVVWLAGEPIGDVAAAVGDLRRHGIRVVFATNNSAPTTQQLLDRLARVGIDSEPGDLATSAAAAATLLEPGQSVKVLAEGGMLEALHRRGVAIADEGPVDAAVVGWSHTFDFDRLASVASAARASGRLIATNEDPTHPTPAGLVPGSGALVAAVATASGLTPEVAGKPHRAMARLMQDRFGFGEGDTSVVVVGDQPRTDGRLAERMGIPFALVDSGVTPAGPDGSGVPVARRSPDLVTLVRESLSAQTSGWSAC